MTAPPRQVLVVGAGLAATQTVAALRAHGFDGGVVVLGAEGLAPYDRPPLSKHLLDRPGPTWLADEIGADLLALADEVRLDEPAHALRPTDTGAVVVTARGERTADAVVLATGAQAVVPTGWHALSLHTAADAARLRGQLRPGSRLVVVGAGWIGAEVAGVAAAYGVRVTVVEAADAPLSTALGSRVGALTAGWYEAAGVRLRTRTTVADVRPDGVVLADGEPVPADAVLVAVGARPRTGWLSGTLPLEPDGALRVDERYAVLGAPAHVRAVGDVALRRSPRHGWVPGGHWDGALRGPSALVADLLGAEPPADADPAPYVFSTQLGHELALFGQAGPEDDVVLRGDPEAGTGWAALRFRPGTDTLTAVLVVDRPRDVGGARRLFTGSTLPRVDRSVAADPARALREATLG